MIKKPIEPKLTVNPELSEAIFTFGKSVQSEIHIVLRKEGGEYFVEIQGGGAISVYPRAANVIRVQLKNC